MHYIHDPKIRCLHLEPLYALERVSHRYPDGTLALQDVSLTIQPGDRIAQQVVMPIARVQLQVVDTFVDSARGEGGFGHTGAQ